MLVASFKSFHSCFYKGKVNYGEEGTLAHASAITRLTRRLRCCEKQQKQHLLACCCLLHPFQGSFLMLPQQILLDACLLGKQISTSIITLTYEMCPIFYMCEPGCLVSLSQLVSNGNLKPKIKTISTLMLKKPKDVHVNMYVE